MPIVQMPDGALVDMPDNPTPEELAELEAVLNPPYSSKLADQTAALAGEGKSLLRQGGLALRAGVKGAAVVPAMGADAVTGLINHFAGTKIPQQLPALDRAMTQAGLPEPQGMGERVVQEATTAMASTGGMAGVAPALAQVRPGLQVASAGMGGGAADLAKENDAPWWGQLLAGLAGAAAPGAATAVATGPANAVRHIAEPWSQSGRDQVKGRLLERLAGDKKQTVLDSLRENRQFVPGTTNTAATAAAPAGSAELAGAERLLGSKYAPSKFADIQKGNEAARAAQVSPIAGTALERGAVKWRLQQALKREDLDRVQELSQQLKRMETADKLSKGLTSALGVERPGKFAEGLRQAPSGLFNKQQSRALGGVQQDLIRQQAVKEQGQQGLRGAQDIIGEAFTTIEPPGMLHRPTMLLRAALERIQHGTSQKTMRELANDMTDPAKIEALLRNARPDERLELLKLIRQISTTTATGGAAAGAQTGE